MPVRKVIRVTKNGKTSIVRAAVSAPPTRRVVTPTTARVTPKQASTTAAAGNAGLVVIEDHVIKMMLADPRFLTQVPCLQSGKLALSSAVKKCGRCSKQRGLQRRNAMNTIRRCLANLQGPEKAAMKRLLGAKKVRVVLQGGKKHITY